MSCRNTSSTRLAKISLLLVVSLFSGCGYGEISPVTYEYAKTIYGLSNRQATDRIDRVEEQIAVALDAGEIPAHEAAWLTDLCEDCRAGRWEEAQAASRRMMEDQVNR